MPDSSTLAASWTRSPAVGFEPVAVDEGVGPEVSGSRTPTGGCVHDLQVVLCLAPRKVPFHQVGRPGLAVARSHADRLDPPSSIAESSADRDVVETASTGLSMRTAVSTPSVKP